MKSGVSVLKSEIRKKDQWAAKHLLNEKAKMPFSFVYGGKPSEQLLVDWPRKVEVEQLDDVRTRHTIVWTDPATGLEVRCALVDYANCPVLEWTVHFRNTGKSATPILERIQGLDIILKGQGEFVLHHNQGDTCGPNAYEPFSKTLAAGSEARFSPVGGRPTSMAFPYFNLQRGGSGIIVALGWPGQWAARFAATAPDKLQVQGGQELTHLRLQPGEDVRAPLSVLLFWDGDVPRSQNLWRRWMLAHNTPRRQGQLPPPISAMCAGLNQNEAGEKSYIDLLVRNDAELDYWWMDAGWYPGTPGPMGEWTQAGTWQPDPKRFPGGVKAVADFAHARDMRLVLWFELERVSPDSAWSKHPEWLLAVRPKDRRFRLGGRIGTPQFVIEEAERNQIREDDRLLNLGNPEALRFLTDYVSKCISDWGIDLFRLDFNISPLLFWRAADAPSRQGMTENRYVCGLLKFFDELRSRHPHLLIDSCASGGRRIDLETSRRTVVYTRSDYWCVSTTGDQCQTAGIASWIPHYMCAAKLDDTYNFRSNLAPALGVFFPNDIDKTDWQLYRKHLAEWRSLADYYYGDYYPLSAWNNREDGCLAWQFHRPDQGDGLVQAFRRPDYAKSTQILRLHGLDPAAQYEMTNFDVEGTMRASGGSTRLTTGGSTRLTTGGSTLLTTGGSTLLTTGKELMAKGLTVEIKDKPGAAVITYKKANG